MKLYQAFLFVALILFFSGCGAKHNYNQSHIFDSFDDFKAGPKGGVDLIWYNPSIKNVEELNQIFKQYNSVIVDKVRIILDDKTRYDNLSEKEIVGVAEYLNEKIKMTIPPRFNLVETPKEKTLRISVVLTNIETPNPILAVTSSIIPIGLTISAITKVATGEHTNVGSATIEFMVSDANSGEQLFAAIDRKAGNKDISTIIDSTDDAKDAINWWVERIELTLRGDTNKPQSQE